MSGAGRTGSTVVEGGELALFTADPGRYRLGGIEATVAFAEPLAVRHEIPDTVRVFPAVDLVPGPQ